MTPTRLSRSTLVVTAATGYIAAIGAMVAGCNSGNGSGGGSPLGPVPTITGVNPNQGSLAGSTLVNISIANGTFGPGATASFGANAATVVSTTATQLTVQSPAATTAGPVDVVVTLNGPGSLAAVATGAFTYQSMIVSSVSPNTGPLGGGGMVTITGEGFQNVTAVSILSTFTVNSMTQITGTLAANPTPGPVDVTVTSSTQGTATLQGGFSYQAGSGGGGLIGITSLDVNAGVLGGGTLVTISGFGFTPGTQTVTFGTATATIVSEPDAMTITVQAPAQLGPGPVAVTVTSTTNGSFTLPGGFTYISPGNPPMVASIVPATGPEAGGTNVTITGTGFLGADLATIGSTLLSMKVVSDSTITGVTAPYDDSNGVNVAPESLPVVVTSPFGTSDGTVQFTYTPSLFITSVTPNQGPRSGGTTVKIFGRNFRTGTTNNVTGVTFNGVNGSALNVLSPTELDITTPAGAFEGSIAVTVVGNQSFSSATRPRAFVYGELFGTPTLPAVDSLDPAGDILGSQGAGTAAQLAMQNIGQTAGGVRSRVATGDLTVYEGEFLAVTLPLGNQVYVSGATVTENVKQGSLLEVNRMATEATLGVGSVPTDVVWTDVNGDGTSDVVVGLDNGNIQVLLLAGPPTFVSGQAFGAQIAGGGPGAVVGISTADVDGDGLFDIVSTRGTNLDVFLNNGAGSFAPATSIPLGKIAVRVVGADPNGVSNLGMDPELHQHLIFNLPGQLKGDVNRDGKSDVILLNADGTLTVLFGNGDGTFDTQLDVATGAPIGGPTDIVVEDFTGDKRVDIAVLGTGSIAVFKTTVNKALATTSIAQIQTITFPPGSNPTTANGMTALDIDNDCSMDLVICNANVGGPNIGLWLNNADLSFAAPSLYAAQVAPNNGSQFQHLDVAASRRRAVWAAGDFGNPVPSSAPNALKGTLEIDRDQISFFTGNAPTQLGSSMPVGIDPRAVRFGDLDDDGNNDVVVANFGANTLSVRLGNGDGTFQPQFVIPTGMGPESLALGDVDLDGDLDIVAANNLNATQPYDQITVHLNTGNGTFGAGVAFTTQGRGARDIRLADVNNDGDLDAVVVHQTSNNVAVLLGTIAPTGTAASSFAAPALYSVGNRPFSLAVADMGTPEGTNSTLALQPDGRLDLVVANLGDDTVTVLYNGYDAQGNVLPAGTSFGRGEAYPLGGSIQPNVSMRLQVPPLPPIQRTGVEPRGVVVVDINMDGFLDIVTVDQGTSTISILHANAANRTANPATSFYPNPFHLNPAHNTCNSMNVRLGIDSGSTTPIRGINSQDPSIVRKWFLPRDYEYATANEPNDIGSPQVVIKVGATPQFISVADMNVDGRPDLVIGSFDSADITILINAGTDQQGGSFGPSNLFVPQPPNAQCPPALPPYYVFSPVLEAPGIGEVFFRSPRFDLTGAGTDGYSGGSRTATPFVVPVAGRVTGMDVDRVNKDCPPDPGVVLDNQTLRIQRGE